MKRHRFQMIESLGLIAFIIFLASPLYATFYKYRDAGGAIRYTDDLNQVPPDQRPGAKEYRSTPADPESQRAAVPQEKPKAVAPAPPSSPSVEGGERVEDTEKNRVRLDQQRQALDKEYQDLMNEKSRLDQEKSSANTRGKLRQINEQIIELNEKITLYDGKRSAFNAEVESFNARVEQLNKDQKQKSAETLPERKP